jgi:hypothetical protein
VNLRVLGYDLTLLVLVIVISWNFVMLLLFTSSNDVENLDGQNDDIDEAAKEVSENSSQPGSNNPETFIVTLKDQNSSADLQEIVDTVEQKGGNVTNIYSHALSGFSVQIPADKKTEIMYYLVSDMRVASVETDQTMSLPRPLD